MWNIGGDESKTEDGAYSCWWSDKRMSWPNQTVMFRGAFTPDISKYPWDTWATVMSCISDPAQLDYLRVYLFLLLISDTFPLENFSVNIWTGISHLHVCSRGTQGWIVVKTIGLDQRGLSRRSLCPSLPRAAMQAQDAQSHPLNPSTVRALQEFILNLNWTKLKHAPCCARERCSKDPWWSDFISKQPLALNPVIETVLRYLSSAQLIITSDLLLHVQTAVHIALEMNKCHFFSPECTWPFNLQLNKPTTV